MHSQLPEQGQLVRVREGNYVVTEVRRSSLLTGSLEGPHQTAQHLVSLVSVEDDAHGEELQVVWEIEPGATVREQFALPEPVGFDEPARLDAFLDAVRWGAISSADTRTLQAPFRSGIDIEDYQLDPVVRAIQMPRVNLLVADDVGLGKTIEAGLVLQELILRQRARRVLIVCPSSLQVQWKEQMRDKFGLDFRIVDSALLKELRRRRGLHVNPWTHFPRLITSIDFVKRERPMRLMREMLPAEGEDVYPRRFDLLIVDEAHNVAPSGSGQYAIDSQRTLAIRVLAPHFEHKLFLTATPHNGYKESFTALLELLDSQRFARGVEPDRKQLQAIMVRRLKQELKGWDGAPAFAERQLEALEVEYTPEERRVHAELGEYARLRERSVGEGARYATEFVLKLLKKRLFSSPAAFATTLAQHRSTLQSRPQASTPAHRSAGILRRALQQSLDEEFGDDTLLDEALEQAVGTASQHFEEPTAEELAMTGRMLRWAETASERPDAKAQKLMEWLDTHLRLGGKWTDERVIIFTEYRATQKWLHTILAGHGYAEGDRLLTMYGGMDSAERERIKAAFQAKPNESPVRILLATDAASEGINLQNHCSRLIHYEIPWNPNRLEQRNGRVDRHGQKAPSVNIYHFVGSGYGRGAWGKPGELEGDLEFLMRAALKVNAIRQDLGKVGPVIAQQVEEAMLGFRTQLDTAAAERTSEPIRQMLKFERQLREQIEKLSEQLQETKYNLRLTPENIQAVVGIGLKLADKPSLDPLEARPGMFRMPQFVGSWADCNEGLADPHTGERRPVVFDPALARGNEDVVLLHLNHRLVQMCLRLLRAEVWASGERRRLYRVTARIVPGSVLEQPAMIAHARLVILGGDQQRLHEELITAGGLIKEGRFSRINLTQIRRALEQASSEPLPAAFQQKLAGTWSACRQPLLDALNARAADRSASLQNALAERAEKEAANIATVLTELLNSILAEIERPHVQLELFNDAEQEQLRRNVESLRHRAEQIPLEIEKEGQVIRSRFENPQARLFPVAVTYLVPAKLARL